MRTGGPTAHVRLFDWQPGTVADRNDEADKGKDNMNEITALRGG